ncbi:MAG: TaqI-like C-terminal specificity domain-containing protein [Desulfobacterales bacterium]
MANLFTDTFFRKQMGKIKAELGIDEAQIEKYIKIVQKRADYLNSFDPEKNSEEKDWPGFEKDVFRDLLGYKITDDDPSDYNVSRQKRIKEAGRGGGTGKADCTLGFYSKKRKNDDNDPVIVEFKAPDTKDLKEAENQLWGYLERHENAKWGIVTNFNEFTLYNFSAKRLKKQPFYFTVREEEKDRKFPMIRYLGKDEKEDDNKKSACIGTDKEGNKYDYSELIKFLAIFRKDRLISEQGDSPTDRMLAMQGTEEKKVEKEFYEKYYRLRIDLFNEIAEHNPQYRKKREELVSITQKILDRLIFIWFCEDSREELLPRDILQRLIGGLMKKDLRSENDVWDEIRKLFKAIDDGKGYNIGNGYNGELFKPDSRIDDLVIPNRIFEQQVKPIGEEYDFGHENELSVNILGHIFEQSITDLEELKQGKPADKKTGKRKREGVYYTPEYITRYIVQQALGGWLAERRKELGEDSLPELTDQVKKKSPKKGGKPSARKPKITEKMKKELLAATGNGELITKLGFLKSSFKDEAELRLALSTVPEAEAYTDMIVKTAMPEDKDLADWYILEKYWRSYREMLKSVKVLDPACGSGAFLIQAFDYLHEEGTKVNSKMEELGLGNENIFDLDREILENNLYGVDINDESVEITKLSLWLKTAAKHKKLNNLFNNVKCGNSLIDDPKVAGKKAFKWEKEFPEIMKNGGVDVVIGNPPYGAKIPKTELQHILLKQEQYGLNPTLSDTYIAFYILSLTYLLNNNGYLGFITPNTWRLVESGKKFREFLFSEFLSVKQIVQHNEKVFSDATVDCDSVFVKKTSETIKSVVEISVKNREKTVISHSIEHIRLSKQNYINLYLSERSYDLIEKIKKQSVLVKDCLQIKNGVKPYEKGKGKPPQTAEIMKTKPFTSEVRKDDSYSPLIGGSLFHRYRILWNNNYWIQYGEWLAAPRDKSIFEAPEKLVFRQTGDSIIGTYLSDKYIIRNNCHIILPITSQFNLKYILAILNSKIINYYYWTINPEKGEALAEIKLFHLGSLCFPDVSNDKQEPFIEKADTMLNLNKELSEKKENLTEYLTANHNIDKLPQKLQHPEALEFADFIKELKKKKVNTDDKTVYDSLKDFHTKIRELKAEIDKTDREIDQMVYDLYDLSEEERKIVEQACGNCKN